MVKSVQNKLGFLGEDFQFKLVHEFVEDKEFFKDLCDIIDQNLFTDPSLKTFVGVMREEYKNRQYVPSYDAMKIALVNKSRTENEKEYYEALVDTIHSMEYEGSESVREIAEKFFKQQNMVRVANEILKIAGDGNSDNYDKCVEMLNKALMQGINEDMGSCVFDDEAETLSDDYRVVIPTGVDKIDETLEGGLGKGELGVIVGSSSFGKVQPYDAKIMTPDGVKMMSEINPGSYVLGVDGKPHIVTEIFPHKDWEFYRVTFSDGSSTECGKEHLWTVSKGTKGIYRTLSLEDIMKEGVTMKSGKYRFKVPVCDAVSFKKNTNPFESNIEDRIEKLLEYSGEYYPYKVVDGKVVGHDFLAWVEEKNINDVLFLIRSLGGVPEVVKDGLDGCFEDIFTDESLRGHFVRGIWNADKYIASIEYSRKADGQCIMVDVEDHLYLTDDFIVTHNTSLTTAMASYAATYRCPQNDNDGFKVLQIVFEDRIKQIQRKHFGRITGVEAKDLSKPEYIDIVKQKLADYKDRDILQKNLRIVRLPSGEKTADDIKRLILRERNTGFSPDLVIVDYFECLRCKGEISDDKWEKEGKTMRKFESMAGELNIGLWIPVQGTKDSLNAEVVTMDKAGGSFKKIQIAHIVMSIARTVEDINKSKATFAILKNRAGQAGAIFNGVDFNNGTCTISTENVNTYDTMFTAINDKRKDRLDSSFDVAKNLYHK